MRHNPEGLARARIETFSESPLVGARPRETAFVRIGT